MIDLFNIKEKNKNYLHNNFLFFMNENNKPIRKVIEDWSKDFVDRDKKFIDEFQRTFNSSYWELYCHAVFSKMGLSIDYRYEHPDFVIVDEHSNSIATIEATISNPPDGGVPEYDEKEKIEHTMSVEESVYLSTIRLSNSITTKYKKYMDDEKGYKKLSYVKDKPFIIAVAPFDQPNFQISSIQSILRVLYGVDTEYKMGNYIINDKFTKIINKNGSDVQLGLFTNGGMQEVGAVLFSCVGTTGKARAISNQEKTVFYQMRYSKELAKPVVSINYRLNTKNSYSNKEFNSYVKKCANKWKESLDPKRFSFAKPFIQEGYEETLTDGLHLFLNPYACGVYKVTDDFLELFKKNGVNIHNYNKDTRKHECIHPVDKTLFQRKVEIYI